MRLWTAVRLQTAILYSLCRRTLRPFGRVHHMRASDYTTAIEVVTLAIWVEFALRLMPFSVLLERLKQRPPHVMGSGEECQRLHRYVAIAYEVLPFPATCLRRSVVLHGLLERRGVPSRVCFGVAKNGVALDAHAWVECAGVTPDAAAAGFRELQTYRVSTYI